MGTPLHSLSVHGFMSIKSLDAFQIRDLNVLTGANGAGKSNFVDFLRMLRAVADQPLQSFINDPRCEVVPPVVGS
jgi:predicted ATPase